MPIRSSYLRFTPKGYGNYILFEKFKEEGLYNKIQSLFKLTKFSGIFSIEFLRDENDHFYFLEILFNVQHKINKYFNYKLMDDSNNETTDEIKTVIRDNEPEINSNNNNTQTKTENDLSNEILYFSINQDSKWVRYN